MTHRQLKRSKLRQRAPPSESRGTFEIVVFIENTQTMKERRLKILRVTRLRGKGFTNTSRM